MKEKRNQAVVEWWLTFSNAGQSRLYGEGALRVQKMVVIVQDILMVLLLPALYLTLPALSDIFFVDHPFFSSSVGE